MAWKLWRQSIEWMPSNGVCDVCTLLNSEVIWWKKKNIDVLLTAAIQSSVVVVWRARIHNIIYTNKSVWCIARTLINFSCFFLHHKTKCVWEPSFSIFFFFYLLDAVARHRHHRSKFRMMNCMKLKWKIQIQSFHCRKHFCIRIKCVYFQQNKRCTHSKWGRCIFIFNQCATAPPRICG